MSLDENGKIKENIRNIFYPSNWVTKIFKTIEKKSGIDEVLSYCSQVEKIKKYMFSTNEELEIFNHLPDLDIMEILPVKKDVNDLRNSVAAMIERRPDAKIIDVIEKI